MRQTPFGVWNKGTPKYKRWNEVAPMRQTPFGVWNPFGRRRRALAGQPLQ